MGFNKRKMEGARRQEAEKEAAARRAIDRQILEDAEQLVTAWNERPAIGSCGRAARPAAPPATLAYGRSIGTAARPDAQATVATLCPFQQPGADL